MANATMALKQGLGANNLVDSDSQSFVLATSDFVAVQVYVEQGSLLPTTPEEFKNKIGFESGTDPDFQQMLTYYSQIATHCSFFKSDTFPATVRLASDVVNYNTKVPVYYGAINTQVNAVLTAASPEDKSKAMIKLKAIIKNLRDDAQVRANNASAVKQKIHDFAEQTKKDRSDLQPMHERIENRYNTEGGLIATYLEQVKTARQEIQRWNAKYEHDMKVASTTPTYAWVLPPIGLVAAATVAGVYGKQATEALDKVHEYEEKLQTAEENLRNALNLIHNLQLADSSLDNLLPKLDAAVEALGRMEGFWGALADDLTNIITVVIDQDIDGGSEPEDDPIEWQFMKELGVTQAINSWAEVAKKADQYRQNAYVIVKTEAEIKANPGSYALPKAA